jgi:hypothetical protein
MSDKNSKDDNKEDKDEQASQATDHMIVKIKTRFPKKSGASTRSNPAMSKHLRMPNDTSTGSQPQGSSYTFQ